MTDLRDWHPHGARRCAWQRHSDGAVRDLTTLFGAAAVLVAIGGIAGALPARRASVIDPARVLREG